MEQRSSRIEILRNNEETVKNFKWASEQNDVPSKLTLNKSKTQWSGGDERCQRNLWPKFKHKQYYCRINSSTNTESGPTALC